MRPFVKGEAAIDDNPGVPKSFKRAESAMLQSLCLDVELDQNP